MESVVDLPIREIDTSSIQQQMARNKEQLQIKLMVRRPISQLIEQGIIPPLRQSPVLYEQTKKLERARTEDYLKHKISNRPNRQELIQHHILEDTNISPMLIAKQQQLKKAKLADNLNERLSHRPGPLELIKGNILLPSNLQIGQAVKQAIETIEFKPTSCGEIKYPQPSFLILKKDQQAETLNNKQNNTKTQVIKNGCNNYHFDHHCNSLIKSNNDMKTGLVDTNTGLIEALGGRSSETNNGVVSVNKVAELEAGDEDENDDSNHTCSSYSSDCLNENEESSISNSLETGQELIGKERAQSPQKQKSTEHDLVPINQLSSGNQLMKQSNQTNQFTNQPIQTNHHHTLSNQKLNKLSNNCLIGNLNNKALLNRSKKNKSKIQAKNKIIKFHEYKGPPNAIKQNTFNDCPRTETAYELLLQQQQLYLQLELQLEMQKKQQHMNSQQIANQRIESLNQKEQDKICNSSSNISMICKSNESIAKNRSVNNSEPSSPMQINKEYSPTNIDQKEKDEITNSAIVNTSLTNTSMTNSPVQSNNKTSSFIKNESSFIIDTLTDINKIEEMKVNDLKHELKRFNLPISGSKTTLIERLKNYVSKSKLIKCSNSPASVESMDVDSISRTNSSNTSLNNIQITPATTVNSSNLYTNTISSTPVTTFANVALAPADASNLLGTTFLAQSPAIIRSTFNPASNTGYITATANKPPQSPNSETIKQDAQSKPRRISEPQLQHIQLHFANPFLQFATTTTTQSPLNTTPLTNRNSAAQQIHFLSTPALNTNDLHLFTQPTTLLTSNNRILQPTNASFTTTNQPTTWTFQPSNNFPQLFFYPTQLAAPSPNAGLVTANNSSQSNLISSNASLHVASSINQATLSNLSNSTGLACKVSNANVSNSNNVNQMTKCELYSSESESAVTSNQQQRVRQKGTKNLKQTKTSKSMNKKMSINSSNSNVTNTANNVNFSNNNSTCSIDVMKKNGSTESKISLPGSLNSQLTNGMIGSNNSLNYQEQTNYAQMEQTMSNLNEPETKSNNNYTTVVIGQQKFENAQNTIANSYLRNSSLQNFFSTSTIMLDKQPPPYEVATRQSKSFLANKDHLKHSSNNTKNVLTNNQQSNSTFPMSAINLGRSSETDNLLNEQQLNNVIMNDNYSNNSTTNSYSTNSILKPANSMQHDPCKGMQATSTNLINAKNIGINLTNATQQTTKQLARQQSSSLEFGESNANLEFKNNILKQETRTAVEDNVTHHSAEFYSNIVCNGAQSAYETHSYDTNSPETFEIKTMNEYSSSLNQTQFASFHYPSSQGINANSTDCYTTTNPPINNCINDSNNRTINHTSLYHPMETECINQGNQLNESNQIDTNSAISNNIKTEVDFNIDFDLLMEVPDFFDFEYNNSYNKTSCPDASKQQSNQNREQIHNQNFMEIDANRLTIDTNFDDDFTSTITEQSMHTPTLPEKSDVFDSQEQVINNLIDTTNATTDRSGLDCFVHQFFDTFNIGDVSIR